MTTDKKKLRRYSERYWEIENYAEAAASPIMYHVHHKKEDDGKTSKQLKESNEYYHCDPEDLIFIPAAEHISKHTAGTESPMKGKHLSDETKKRLSVAHIGKKPWNKGIPLSDDTKKKMSEKLRCRKVPSLFGKKRSEETKMKISETLKKRCGDWVKKGREACHYKEVCPLLLFKYRYIDGMSYQKIRETLEKECGIVVGTMAVHRKTKQLNIKNTINV